MNKKWTWNEYVDGGPNLDQRLIKIAKLLKRMRAWMNENNDTPMDSPNGIMYGKDMDFVNNVKLGLSGMLTTPKFNWDRETKIILNKIWKRYA
tara:strand:- start:286 stop:564 length:279 start_codon:yes stop_codon:yes gene_type:complete